MGIFASRLVGLVRQRVFAHYFGSSDAADAFTAAFRIPNLLQNLFGEGVLSASFIPVYAQKLAQGDAREAQRLAGAILAVLAAAMALLVLGGVLTAPWLVDLVAPGFAAEKRDLTVCLVRILFPGAGLLVLSAWFLGVLNSHGKFLLSYAAPVAWNLAMIGTLVLQGTGRSLDDLAVSLAWGSVVGSGLQLAVQLPAVVRLVRGLRVAGPWVTGPVAIVLRNFPQTLLGRGVVQISAFVDSAVASLLPTGAAAAMGYAQTLTTLPVSLFGMSVSAAELPAMSSFAGQESERQAHLRRRLDAGLRRIARFVIPTMVAFIFGGDLLAGAIYETGRFTRADSLYVWAILATAAVGLLASTQGRLYASAFHALQEPREPYRCALYRVGISVLLGVPMALWLPGVFGVEPRWGVAGLSLAASFAAIFERRRLRQKLIARIGGVPDLREVHGKFAGVALLAGLMAGSVRYLTPSTLPTLIQCGLFLSVLGGAYVLGLRLLGLGWIRDPNS